MKEKSLGEEVLELEYVVERILQAFLIPQKCHSDKVRQQCHPELSLLLWIFNLKLTGLERFGNSFHPDSRQNHL